ncbi:SPOR domain-containing protein [Salinibacter sp.]|uniref:SPOR domain-containing protein n=1 Tax=Salinibacter sp. TaxID=2065818 RepID=UPI0021E8521F|nr:SPOR domain-containing protein [Salinibacter sp.]
MALPNALPVRVLSILAGVCISGMVLGACSGPGSTGRSSEGEPGTRIYHVQLRLTEDKGRATEALGRAERWWRERPPADRPPLVQGTSSSGRPVTITWKAPLYRVRLGPFATETQAEAVLDAARPAFPDAFVAPDRPEAAPRER